MSNHAIIAECLITGAVELRLLREWMPCRRERIATAALQGLLARNGDYRGLAQKAVAAADALIAELDKKEGGI